MKLHLYAALCAAGLTMARQAPGEETHTSVQLDSAKVNQPVVIDNSNWSGTPLGGATKALMGEWWSFIEHAMVSPTARRIGSGAI